MNKLQVTVQNIQTHQELHLVKFLYHDTPFTLVSLDVNVKKNQNVIIGFKPTAVAIGKNFDGQISYSNVCKCIIAIIEFGTILTHVKANFKETILESTITTESAKRLDLKKNDTVFMFIKSSDVFIIEALNEY